LMWVFWLFGWFVQQEKQSGFDDRKIRPAWLGKRRMLGDGAPDGSFRQSFCLLCFYIDSGSPGPRGEDSFTPKIVRNTADYPSFWTKKPVNDAGPPGIPHSGRERHMVAPGAGGGKGLSNVGDSRRSFASVPPPPTPPPH